MKMSLFVKNKIIKLNIEKKNKIMIMKILEKP